MLICRVVGIKCTLVKKKFNVEPSCSISRLRSTYATRRLHIEFFIFNGAEVIILCSILPTMRSVDDIIIIKL